MVRQSVIALALGLTAGSLAVPSAGRAQSPGGGDIVSRGGFQPPFQRTTPTPAPRQPAPPAIPGAAPQSAAAVPAEKPALDMPPTEALFDAINRGDLAGAKEALNRGADLDGRNVLGMTPVDLSVDLSRNDITFLLLSLRAAPPPAVASATTIAGKTGTGSKTAAAVVQEAGARNRHARHAQQVAGAARPVQATRYASGNPGSPVPQAGFLGFGGAGQP